jgi:xanthosine utilization system XapX-like protein
VTASTLLLYISLALGLQIMLGLAYALLRRRVPASPLLSVSKTAAPIVQSGD